MNQILQEAVPALVLLTTCKSRCYCQVGELQLTCAVLVSGKGKCALTIQADDGKEFTLCTLISGSREQSKLDLLLGAGNDRITFRVSGEKTTLHLTGYVVVPEENPIVDDDDIEEKEEKKVLAPGSAQTSKKGKKVPKNDEKELARSVIGSARLADDDEDDDDFEEGDEEEDDEEDDEIELEDEDEDDDVDVLDSKSEKKAASRLFAADDEDADGEDVRLPLFEGEDGDEEEKEEIAQVKATTKKMREAAPKKRKTAETSNETQALKKKKDKKSIEDASKTASAATTPEETFKQTIVSYLKEKGASPLSKLGNDCKKPAEIKTKLKAFIAGNADTFKIEGLNVKLKE